MDGAIGGSKKPGWIFMRPRLASGCRVRLDQLRYFVQRTDIPSGIRTKTLSYEPLLGFGFGRWDMVTSDSQVEAVDLLRERIADLVGIPDRAAEFGTP